MVKKICEVCCSNKTAVQCSECGCASCKHCSYFVDDSFFEFSSYLPKDTLDKTYCPNCYNENVADTIEQFKEILAKAKDVNVYMKIQGSETRLIRRIEKPVKVNDCIGREETLMRLAFLAAQKGYDTIVDVDLVSEKSKEKSYKKVTWSGTAVPVNPKRKK